MPDTPQGSAAQSDRDTIDARLAGVDAATARELGWTEARDDGPPSVADLLHDIADHLEAGREFHRGEWVQVAPLLGPAVPWRRKAWIEGVEISREVIARQLRDVADWHWNPDVS